MAAGKYIVRLEDVEPYSPPLHSGTVNRRLVGRQSVGAQNIEVVLGVLEKGGGAEKHAHNDVEQAMYILEGRAIVEVGEVREEVGPNTALFFPPGVAHALEVVSETPLKTLVIYGPPIA